MSDYEPPAEMVEALAKELHEAYQGGLADCQRLAWDECAFSTHDGRKAQARFVLRRQHERERRLLAGIVRAQEWLSVGSMDTAQHELSETRVWYNKLDAPKVPEAPTLLEAAKALTTVGRGYPESNVTYVLVGDWNALKAAVEREEKREKR